MDLVQLKLATLRNIVTRDMDRVLNVNVTTAESVTKPRLSRAFSGCSIFSLVENNVLLIYSRNRNLEGKNLASDDSLRL